MHEEYILKLYVAHSNTASDSALKNLKEIINKESEIKFQLEIVDVREHPELAEEDKILAIPTLIRKLPEPIKKIIGDLSDIEKVLFGLDLIPQKQK